VLGQHLELGDGRRHAPCLHVGLHLQDKRCRRARHRCRPPATGAALLPAVRLRPDRSVWATSLTAYSTKPGRSRGAMISRSGAKHRQIAARGAERGILDF